MLRTNPYGLTDRQFRFVQEYLLDLNATAAYERAGYKTRGPGSRVNAAKLLTNPNIIAAIQAEQDARAQRVHLTQDAVLHEIALLSHSDIMHYTIDDYGNVDLRDGAPAQAMRAVASLKKKVMHTEHATIYETEIKLWNKPASLRMGGQHLGLFKEQIDIGGTVKVVRLPEKAASAEHWQERHPLHASRGTDLGAPTETN